MALVVKRTERIEHPTETDAWFVIRTPLSAGDLTEVSGNAAQQVQVTIELMARIITEWSYDAPVNVENVARLDLDTFAFLNQAIMARSGVTAEREQEKKGSSSPSRRTSGRVRVVSRQSSGT